RRIRQRTCRRMPRVSSSSTRSSATSAAKLSRRRRCSTSIAGLPTAPGLSTERSGKGFFGGGLQVAHVAPDDDRPDDERNHPGGYENSLQLAAHPFDLCAQQVS